MNEHSNVRISVIVITYNQEKVIGRALDSVLIQKEWGLYEMIVCDDCSGDNNWDVIMKYKEKYPNIIKSFKNEQNLGIYGNAEYALSKLGDTDIVFILSGDDALCDGIFKGVCDVVSENSINLKNDLFSIYFDWKSVTPNGKEHVFSQKLVTKGYKLISLKIRGLITGRSMGSSINVIRKQVSVPKDKGVSVSEVLFDNQAQINTQKAYYKPIMGSIYYCNVGVSTKMTTNKHKEELIEAFKELKSFASSALSRSDMKYLDLLIQRIQYFIHPSIKSFMLALWYFFLSLDIRYHASIFKDLKMFAVMLIKGISIFRR